MSSKNNGRRDYHPLPSQHRGGHNAQASRDRDRSPPSNVGQRSEYMNNRQRDYSPPHSYNRVGGHNNTASNDNYRTDSSGHRHTSPSKESHPSTKRSHEISNLESSIPRKKPPPLPHVCTAPTEATSDRVIASKDIADNCIAPVTAVDVAAGGAKAIADRAFAEKIIAEHRQAQKDETAAKAIVEQVGADEAIAPNANAPDIEQTLPRESTQIDTLPIPPFSGIPDKDNVYCYIIAVVQVIFAMNDFMKRLDFIRKKKKHKNS